MYYSRRKTGGGKGVTRQATLEKCVERRKRVKGTCRRKKKKKKMMEKRKKNKGKIGKSQRGTLRT